MKEKNLIEEELCQAGEASPVSPLVVKLDKYRIMSDTQVPPEEFLLRLFGKPCFPRRDLSTITGLEKCGKTFFTSMLMACCAEKSVLELERIREEPLKVMWYDTEQSKQSTKTILADRVFKLVGPHVSSNPDGPLTSEQSSSAVAQDADIESNFFVFNVRACTYQERMELLVAGIEAYKPDMVIIDNVSDLLPSVNDSEASIQVMDQLMQMASLYDCNITVVIHLNRSGEKRNLRSPENITSRRSSITVSMTMACPESPASPIISLATTMVSLRAASRMPTRLRLRGLTRSTRSISSVMRTMPVSHGSGISVRCSKMR